MKRFLLIALVAVLVITGGVFAFTFTTATATIGVNAIESDFAQVSANTSYSPPTVFGKFTGTWPTGTLFNVEPYVDADNYTGDLIIKVYLVNAGELIRYYQHLNMALEFRDSDNNTADLQGIAQPGTFQVLTLQNAEVFFEWQYGTENVTPPYKVDLTGGSFRLHPWKTLTGGSVTPQIWAEVTQR